MPKVLNAREFWHHTPDAVKVDRSSKWGNPFVLGRDGTREEVIEKYDAWLPTQEDLMASLWELTGRDLLCWCAPKPCHADILLKLANPDG